MTDAEARRIVFGVADPANALYHARHRLTMTVAKTLAGCADCGYDASGAALEFHHRDPATKVASVASMNGSRPTVVLEEMAKCDLLCANCHSIKTMEDQLV